MIQAGRALPYRPLNRLQMDISPSYVFISGARSALMMMKCQLELEGEVMYKYFSWEKFAKNL